MIGAINSFQDITERKRKEEELRRLSERLIQLQDQERRRIARELHDSTSQTLSALMANLAVIAGSKHRLSHRANRSLLESMDLAEAALREIRTMSYLLRPPVLDELGLRAALTWYVDGFIRRGGIKVHLDIPSDFGKLPEEVETAVLRIVQECLVNVHRHSGSDTAAIRIIRNQAEMIVEFRDQGRGFDETILEANGESKLLGVGLSGMRQRITQLGGQLEMSSANPGAIVRAIFPISEGDA